MIALDLPGFGASEMPASRSRSRLRARRVDAVCDALGIEPAVVVGNSMGGFIAAELAISFPARVERLVLVSAAGLSDRAPARARPLVAAARATSARYAPLIGRLARGRSHGCPRLRDARA